MSTSCLPDVILVMNAPRPSFPVFATLLLLCIIVVNANRRTRNRYQEQWPVGTYNGSVLNFSEWGLGMRLPLRVFDEGFAQLASGLLCPNAESYSAPSLVPRTRLQ